MTNPVLRLEKVRKTFGSEVVLEDITFTVPVHTATVFIGASGSGKSTLLRCINLLDQIDDGQILLDGEDISAADINPDEVRKKLGMVFQSFNLFPHMTVLENVILAPTKVQGVAKDVAVEVMGTSLHSEGPLLITHSGLSAPSILKLSAFGAIELAQLNYKFEIKINFIQQDAASCLEVLMKNKLELSKKLVRNTPLFELPKRLWVKLVQAAAIADELRWADLNKLQLQSLLKQLTKAVFQVHGKSTFKEEFVTAGGIDLKEINFKTYESKLFKNLFFAGEIINIDGVTGGFNFQNAWTGAYLAAQELSK